MSRWYVVHTHPHCEARALAHLTRQCYEGYLPLLACTRRHARKVEIVSRPLFPRYLFIRMDTAVARWRSVLSTVGVAGMIMCGEMPTSVPDGVVDEIRAREDEAGLVRLPPAPGLAVGDTLTVTEGPFAHQIGLFEGMDNDQRVVVLLTMMGGPVRVHLPVEAVELRA